MNSEIYETEWKTSINQLIEVKHFYAFKGSKVGVVCATRGIGFTAIPSNRNSEVFEFERGEAILDNSESQKKKLEEWLLK